MSRFTEYLRKLFNTENPQSSFALPHEPYKDKGELKDMFYDLINLGEANLGLTDLDDSGLLQISEYKNLSSLNVQETEITDQGISYLKNLKNLNHLRLKGNPQLTNACIPFLNDCQELIDLQIHETGINEEGLRELNIPGLEDLIIDVRDGNFSYEFLIEYSAKFPNCRILAKGNGEFLNGKFDGEW